MQLVIYLCAVWWHTGVQLWHTFSVCMSVWSNTFYSLLWWHKERAQGHVDYFPFFILSLPLSLCTQIVTTKLIIACRLGSLGSCGVREKSRHLLFLRQIGFFGFLWSERNPEIFFLHADLVLLEWEIIQTSPSMQIGFFWSEKNYLDIFFHADWVLVRNYPEVRFHADRVFLEWDKSRDLDQIVVCRLGTSEERQIERSVERNW